MTEAERIQYNFSLLKSLQIPIEQKISLIQKLLKKIDIHVPLEQSWFEDLSCSVPEVLHKLLQQPNLGIWITECFWGENTHVQHPFAPFPEGSVLSSTLPLVAQILGLQYLKMREWPQSSFVIPKASFAAHAQDSLQWSHAPSSIAILGGGYIGCELAAAWAQLGVSIHIFDAAPQILPGFADVFVQRVQVLLRELGVEIYCNHRIKELRFVQQRFWFEAIQTEGIILCFGSIA